MPTLYDVSLFFILWYKHQKNTKWQVRAFRERHKYITWKVYKAFSEKERDHPAGGSSRSLYYFVEKGIVKSTIFREGREFIVFFALENEVPFSSPDLIHSGQSLYTLETIDDCILWRISRKDLADLFGTSINLSNWGRMLLQEWLAVSSSYFSSIHWMSKKEQYQYLLEKMPQLVQRLSMRDLSAWLDITPQSLSRIRADIY